MENCCENTEETKEKGSILLQLAATLSVCFSQIGMGCALSWSSPSLHYLMSNESKISVTVNEGAWITSSQNIGAIFGYLTVPCLMDSIGRKYTLLIFAIPQIISWLMIIFGRSVILLSIARAICGYGYACIGLISVYIGEIAQPRIRGILSILMVISGDIGILLVAITGAYLSYQIMNMILLSIPIIYLVSFIFMPESPYFYVMKGRDEEAVRTLMKLRGLKCSKEVESEMNQIRTLGIENQESKKNKLRDIFSKDNIKPLIIVVLFHVTSMISGSLAMIAYAEQIFEYSGFELTPAHSYIILGVVKIIAGIMATQLVETMGRKILHLTSGIFSSLALMTVGIFFLLKLQNKKKVSSINWLPLVGLIVFEISSSMGIGPLPFVVLGEFFPLRLKNVAVTIIFLSSTVVSFFVDLMFPIVNEAFGVYVSFFIFGCCCLTGISFIFYVTPETKGKSLEEIQFILNSRGK